MKKTVLVFVGVALLWGCNLSEDDLGLQGTSSQMEVDDLVGTWSWVSTDFDRTDYATCESFSDLDASSHLSLSFVITENTVSFSDECSEAIHTEGIYSLKYNDPSYDDGSIVIFDDEQKINMIFRIDDFDLEENPKELNLKFIFIEDETALLGAKYNLEKVEED